MPTDERVQAITKDIIISCQFFSGNHSASSRQCGNETKYRGKFTNSKNGKNWKKTVEDIQSTLKTVCQKYSNQETTMELLPKFLQSFGRELGKNGNRLYNPAHGAHGYKNIYIDSASLLAFSNFNNFLMLFRSKNAQLSLLQKSHN